MGEGEVVLGVLLPVDHDVPLILEPGEEMLYPPTAQVATPRAAILGIATVRSVRGNHLDAARGEVGVKMVAVVGLVAAQILGGFHREAAREVASIRVMSGGLAEAAWMPLST